MVEVAIDVLIDGEVSDRRARRTGLRQITWDNWHCSVNGEQIFLKGANYLPVAALPGDATAERIHDDLTAAVDLGLDALRIHGHIADRAVYSTADGFGLLLLQLSVPLEPLHHFTSKSEIKGLVRNKLYII